MLIFLFHSKSYVGLLVNLNQIISKSHDQKRLQRPKKHKTIHYHANPSYTPFGVTKQYFEFEPGQRAEHKLFIISHKLFIAVKSPTPFCRASKFFFSTRANIVWWQWRFMSISLCLSIIYLFIPLINPKIFQHHLVADAVDFESCSM